MWSAGRRLPPIARRKETPSHGVSGGLSPSRSGVRSQGPRVIPALRSPHFFRGSNLQRRRPGAELKFRGGRSVGCLTIEIGHSCGALAAVSLPPLPSVGEGARAEAKPSEGAMRMRLTAPSPGSLRSPPSPTRGEGKVGLRCATTACRTRGNRRQNSNSLKQPCRKFAVHIAASTEVTWNVCISPSSARIETYSPGRKTCAPKR